MKRILSISLWAILSATMLLPVSCCRKDTLKVMSFNIRFGTANDGENCWENRKSAVIAMLDTVNPDIVGMQEVLPFQQEFVVEQCPRFQAYGLGRNDGVEGERMTVIYNKEVLELEDNGTWWLSETPDIPSTGWDAKHPRTATWVLMKDLRCGKEFYLVNTHLDHRGVEARKNGLALVMKLIKDMNPDIPLVLMGDFNVEPGDPCLDDVERLMNNARKVARETDATLSFNGFQPEPQKEIDYIYFNGFKGASQFRVVSESYDSKPFISDHYPIVSTLIY